jgi:hypothetical protein
MSRVFFVVFVLLLLRCDFSRDSCGDVSSQRIRLVNGSDNPRMLGFCVGRPQIV